MPIPHIHVISPLPLRLPGLENWLAGIVARCESDPNWAGCEIHLIKCDGQAAFNVPTTIDIVRRNRGPVIVIQKVQASLVGKLKDAVERESSVYSVCPCSAGDLWETFIAAKDSFERGEPLIPDRELIAFLIIRKLERQKMWGGTALNKSFLWADDLPKGGFPKECSDRRQILQVADVLVDVGILTRKLSLSQQKYALGDKGVIEWILNNQRFPSDLWNLNKYFSKSRQHLPAGLLNYNEG